MNKLAPFLWFNGSAEEAAEFTSASSRTRARRLDTLRSKGAGPCPWARFATITVQLEGVPFNLET
jgi:predicted 3-demethylubiquinone-9 3-methyltransferase (glyoxalase superfamily)